MAVTTKRNIGKTIWIIFIVLIMLIIAGLIVTSLVFKNKDVTPSIFGYSVFIVDEDGMGSKVPEGALVVAKNYSPSAENIGDAILCEGVGDYGTTILRLCDIVPNTETVIYQGFYDNDPKTIYNVPASKLVGQALTYHTTLGAIIRFVTSYKGMAVMVVVPLLILFVCELIVHLVGKSRAKNNIHKDKFKKQLEQYKVPENSPLNPSKIGSHTSGPVTIEDFIFGREEQQPKKNSTVEFKAEKTRQLEKSVEKSIEKAKAERNAKAAANAYKKAEADTRPIANNVKENTVKLERVRVAKPAMEAEKPVVKPAVEEVRQPVEKPVEPVVEEVKKPVEIKVEPVLEKPAPAQEKPVLEKPAPVIEAVSETPEVKPAEAEKKEETAEEKITNSSLERLIKLMEEQEKLLKTLAEKE